LIIDDDPPTTEFERLSSDPVRGARRSAIDLDRRCLDGYRLEVYLLMRVLKHQGTPFLDWWQMLAPIFNTRHPVNHPRSGSWGSAASDPRGAAQPLRAGSSWL
jgi:hypothetical protein